jgi:hypothetical protein
MKLSARRIDSAAIEKGVEIGNIPEWGDLKLVARGSQNADWRNLRAKLVAETAARDILPDGNLRPSRLEEIGIELLVEAGITGWSGLLNEDDTPMPFSKAALREIITNPDYIRFRGACIYACDKVHDVAAGRTETERKN